MIHRQERRQTGAALIAVLALILVLTLTVAGVGTFALGHLAVESDRSSNAAAALLEDAGINFGIRDVSSKQYAMPVPQIPPFVQVSSIPGFGGIFREWVTNVDGSSPWKPPSPVLIHATAVINGVNREAQAIAVEESIFQPYTALGTKSLTISGPATKISGEAATAGNLTFVGAPLGSITGQTLLAGPFAVGPIGPTFFRRPGGLVLPTMDQTVFGSAPVTSWGWLTSNAPVRRSNGRMRQFLPGATAGTPLLFVTTMPVGPPWTTPLPSGETITTAQLATLTHGPDGLSTIVLPPGDYFFTQIAAMGALHIIVDTAGQSLLVPKPGMVRIWMDAAGGPVLPDVLNVTMTTTSPDPTLFRILDRKPTSLTLGPNVAFSGCIFATSVPLNALVTLNGSNIVGSIVADNLALAGGAQLIFPASGVVGNARDYGLYVGLKSGLQEMPLPGQVVFPDGTNN